MTRKKVKLAYITNNSARKATFKKRKKGLMKKVSEFSTLCDVKAFTIIYSPYDLQPNVWPSPLGAQHVLADFKRMPKMEQSKKMVNQESFLRQRITKAIDQLKKQCNDNRKKEITDIMFQSLTGKSLHELILIDLNNLGWLIEQHLKEILESMETLSKSPQPQEATDKGVMKGPGETFTQIKEDSTVQTLQQSQMQFIDGMNLQAQQQRYVGLNGEQAEMMVPFTDQNYQNNGL
ncbi:agamous-like MADS-box protein AGL80, partial [Carica papaya]|uniref:agamous-like MADS-box protein AGL80 n=1 Tax=Carica papaya TaxID=3649 RepID=UPI000B8CF326